MASKIKRGDKFVIRVKEVQWNPEYGHSYLISEIPNLILHDLDMQRLEKYKEPPKINPHTCTNCAYRYCGDEDYPCVVCDKNHVEVRDMFKAVE